MADGTHDTGLLIRCYGCQTDFPLEERFCAACGWENPHITEATARGPVLVPKPSPTPNLPIVLPQRLPATVAPLQVERVMRDTDPLDDALIMLPSVSAAALPHVLYTLDCRQVRLRRSAKRKHEAASFALAVGMTLGGGVIGTGLVTAAAAAAVPPLLPVAIVGGAVVFVLGAVTWWRQSAERDDLLERVERIDARVKHRLHRDGGLQ